MISRRHLLAASTSLGAVAFSGFFTSTPARAAGPQPRSEKEPFGYCLNTATIRGQKLPIDKEVELAAEAGFHALEPWISELEAYEKNGGNLKDLGKKIADLGMTVESMIGFPQWIVDNDEQRAKGFDTAKKNMEMTLAIGGKRLACPPAGATDKTDISLKSITERYRKMCELGDQVGLVAELEFWGASKTLNRLSEAAYIVVECGHPKACVLPDVYHLYKGGSDFNGIKLLSGDAIHVIHMNDYPDMPSRDRINDGDRVYPGDGIAPLKTLFRNLKGIGFNGYLSVELFNRKYWEQDAKVVLKTAVEKTRVAVMSAWS